MAQSKKPARRKARAQLEAKEIEEALSDSFNPNPLKRQIKLKQFPWTAKQKEFFKIALAPDTKIVFVKGPAGTSKTLLAVYCALQLLNMKAISDIMYLRSAVESSDRSLGFLPGSAEEKLRFFNLPFLDKLEELLLERRISKLEEEGRISIILDEAQNSTIKEITTVLTRLGENSRCFVLADPMQTDLKNEHLHGGFEKMHQLFGDEESFENGVKTFEFNEDDVMRSELVKFLTKKLKKRD